MRREILVLLSLALCAAQTANNQSDVHIPAPIFDDGENLSSQNCGIYATENKSNVFVHNQRAGSIRGSLIAISQTTVLTDVGRPYKKSDAPDLRVYPIYCYGTWGTELENCMRDSVQVLDVIDIAINPTATEKFKILITEKMSTEVVTPLCLFNRNNVMDLQLQRESPYVQWMPYITSPISAMVTSQSNCTRVLDSTELGNLKTIKIPIQNILCVENGTDRTDYLINSFKGRYFLRGVKYTRGVYIDILPYIHEIARHAKDISVLRPIPPTKQPRRFPGPDNLSFQNWGRKPTELTRKRRHYGYYPRDAESTRLILAGNTAQAGRHPWHAFIADTKRRATFGGSLISPTVVLTAAHCIYGSKPNDFIVVFGMYDKRQRTPGVQMKNVISLKVHPKYDPKEFHIDVGLMILKKKIEITAHVRPIYLWNEDSNLDRVAGTEAMAVGFGLVDNHTRTNELQEARLPIRGHRECYLSDTRYFGKYLRPGDNFCAGYTNGTTVCNGDSGGSLSVQKDGRWFIRGIVSFTKAKKVMFEGEERSLCDPNHYSLFTDVATYNGWIRMNTPEFSF
ncbi:uncharacterized protein LOC135936734 isoform X2 [Cloeon dipterum]|uniref:uncharacterized protein LOC135936734 isoform X2 n=1 Tax=Cloeon dipterum TaxID=197152 RepID=UPI0032200E9F